MRSAWLALWNTDLSFISFMHRLMKLCGKRTSEIPSSSKIVKSWQCKKKPLPEETNRKFPPPPPLCCLKRPGGDAARMREDKNKTKGKNRCVYLFFPDSSDQLNDQASALQVLLSWPFTKMEICTFFFVRLNFYGLSAPNQRRLDCEAKLSSFMQTTVMMVKVTGVCALVCRL